MFWCVRFLFSFPLLCASAFYSLRLPTEYERNGRYEGSRWGKWFLLKIFYRYLLHFCGRGNTFRTFCVISLLHVGLLREGSSLWSGSVCAGARRPREGAAVPPPPAHRPAPSGSRWCLGVKVPFLLPARLWGPGVWQHCRHVNTPGLVLVSRKESRIFRRMFFFSFFFFGPCNVACGILVPRTGIELEPWPQQ